MRRLVRAPVTCCARAPASHSSCPSLSSFFLKSCGLGLSSCGVGHGRHIAAFKSPIKVEDKPAEEAEANPDFAPIVSTDSLALLGLSLLLEDGHRQCRGRPCIASTIYTHTHTLTCDCLPWLVHCRTVLGLGGRDRMPKPVFLLQAPSARVFFPPRAAIPFYFWGRSGRSWTSPFDTQGRSPLNILPLDLPN